MADRYTVWFNNKPETVEDVPVKVGFWAIARVPAERDPSKGRKDFEPPILEASRVILETRAEAYLNQPGGEHGLLPGPAAVLTFVGAVELVEGSDNWYRCVDTQEIDVQVD